MGFFVVKDGSKFGVCCLWFKQILVVFYTREKYFCLGLNHSVSFYLIALNWLYETSDVQFASNSSINVLTEHPINWAKKHEVIPALFKSDTNTKFSLNNDPQERKYENEPI